MGFLRRSSSSHASFSSSSFAKKPAAADPKQPPPQHHPPQHHHQPHHHFHQHQPQQHCSWNLWSVARDDQLRWQSSETPLRRLHSDRDLASRRGCSSTFANKPQTRTLFGRPQSASFSASSRRAFNRIDEMSRREAANPEPQRYRVSTPTLYRHRDHGQDEQ